MILREEKVKEEIKRKKNRRYKKSKERIIERSDCINWIRKSRYIRENYSRGVVR